jgi:hypothetical protein
VGLQFHPGEKLSSGLLEKEIEQAEYGLVDGTKTVFGRPQHLAGRLDELSGNDFVATVFDQSTDASGVDSRWNWRARTRSW